MTHTLTKWTKPQHYFGASWDDYYSAGVGQSRDSDALERANFDAMVNRLREVDSQGEDSESGGWRIVEESHWAVGWVQWIAIHESATDALAAAEQAQADLADYPVLDDDLFSEYENDDCEATWDYMPASDRIEYLRDHGAPVSGAFRQLRAAVRGDWYQAANLLPCPGDLAF